MVKTGSEALLPLVAAWLVIASVQDGLLFDVPFLGLKLPTFSCARFKRLKYSANCLPVSSRTPAVHSHTATGHNTKGFDAFGVVSSA